MPAYEYHHVVSLEETNLVGNVYYVNHLKWQGRCREMFLKDHAPGILDELKNGLALVTLKCSCEYFIELLAFDEITVSMSLGEMTQSKLHLLFEYWKVSGTEKQLAARGEQEVACLRKQSGEMSPCPIPTVLRKALGAW